MFPFIVPGVYWKTGSTRERTSQWYPKIFRVSIRVLGSGCKFLKKGSCDQRERIIQHFGFGYSLSCRDLDEKINICAETMKLLLADG